MIALIVAPIMLFVFMYTGFAILRRFKEGRLKRAPSWLLWLLGGQLEQQSDDPEKHNR